MKKSMRYLMPVPALLAVIFVFSGCSTQSPPEGRGVQPPRSIGKADGTASCQGICGEKAPAGCWCDAECALYDDCCSDKATECDASAPSCDGICGLKHPSGCWCDDQCSGYGDCCPDKEDKCDAPVDKCADVNCLVSPPTCDGDDLITALDSTCNPATGECEEQVNTTSCPHGCAGGQCELDPVPTPEQCLNGWRNLDCPAPTISASYLGNDCVGTTGWFIEGNYFQFEKDNINTADYGPQSVGANGNQGHWNIITPTKLCVTVYAGFAGTWVGETIYVINPDGKASNSVVVENRL